MKTITLPESKLDLSFGLANIKPYYQTALIGRGVFPDIEIIPSIEDYENEIDPALEWILNDIKTK